MCYLCNEYVKGSMTRKEVRRALTEIDLDKHTEKLGQRLDFDDMIDETFELNYEKKEVIED